MKTGTLIISQGGLNVTSSIIKLVQPLTRLLKITAGKGVGRAEVQSTQGKARQADDKVALTVHQLYYEILIAEAQRSAAQAKIQASEDLQSERVQQAQFGSGLDFVAIESRAESLQAKHDLLSLDLHLSDPAHAIQRCLRIAFDNRRGALP